MTISACRVIIVFVLMFSASLLSVVLTPTKKVLPAQFDIEAIVPHQFGDWRMEEVNLLTVINPQGQALINSLYTKILSRIYVNSKGRRIMLSIAYGPDQSHGKQIHKPEVCYPAQGFQIEGKRKDTIQTVNATLPVMRVIARLDQRYEPVTYWIRLGDVLVRGLEEQTLTRIWYGFRGYIPDGLLFRISEINQNIKDSYVLQDAFISELLPALTPEAQKILLGSEWMN